jgi:hypothetical protein
MGRSAYEPRDEVQAERSAGRSARVGSYRVGMEKSIPEVGAAPPSASLLTTDCAGQGPGRIGVFPLNPTKLAPYSSRGGFGVCGTRSSWVRSFPTSGASLPDPISWHEPSGRVKWPRLCAKPTAGAAPSDSATIVRTNVRFMLFSQCVRNSTADTTRTPVASPALYRYPWPACHYENT